MQSENLQLKQSLAAQAPGGKDTGQQRVLLFERRVQALYRVFTPDDGRETARQEKRPAVESVRAFLDTYVVEVFVPHLQVLLAKLIGGRAVMLAPPGTTLAEPVFESAREVVLQCQEALPELEVYEQQVRERRHYIVYTPYCVTVCTLVVVYRCVQLMQCCQILVL